MREWTVRSSGGLVFLAAWVVWSVCAAYAHWSSAPSRVFPIFAPIVPDGKPARFDLHHLPIDLYRISIGVKHQDEEEAGDTFAFVRELEHSNAVLPMHLNVAVIDENENFILRHVGSTERWFVGTRHQYDASFDFRDMVLLFQSLEFEAHPFSEYALEISLTSENADVLGKQLFVLVSGSREDGYYPLQSIGLLLLSLFALSVLTLLLVYRGLTSRRK